MTSKKAEWVNLLAELISSVEMQVRIAAQPERSSDLHRSPRRLSRCENRYLWIEQTNRLKC